MKTIKFSQLLASVSEDLPKYADEGMIRPTNLIKVVRRCNDVLGCALYTRKECVIPIKNFMGDMPLDFYKSEMIFAVGEIKRNTGLIATGNHYEWTTVQNACMCEGDSAVCVQPLYQKQPIITFKTFTPLHLSDSSLDHCTSKSPNRNWKGKYTIDFDEDLIHTQFEEGTIYLAYLADLQDETTGELLIPFHGRLNDYYEYSVKTKIFEDMMLNTEADVINALAYVKRERNLAFSDATDFVTSKSFREFSRFERERQQKFFNKWYKIFY